MTDIYKILEIMIGFSSGVIIGGAFIALLTVLGIVARLIQLSKSWQMTRVYSVALLLGTLFGTFISFTYLALDQPRFILVFWGTMQGIFNGMLAAALIEVLQVFPVLAKRIRMERYLWVFLTAIIFGKIFGSLYQWLFLMKG